MLLAMNASPISPQAPANIHVAITPALYTGENNTVVAVDVLRATTAICAAFQAGVEEIVPLESLQDLEKYRGKGYLRAAERGGLKVGDAEFGNSPTEYLNASHAAALRHARIAYSTTNGTRCILRGADAQETYVGAFANITALTAKLLTHPTSLTIICSGWEGNFCIEDTLFAGALIARLAASGLYTTHQDAAHMALDLWQTGGSNSYVYCLERASHIQRLEGFGAHDDVVFAFRPDTCPVIPRLQSGKLLLER